MAFQSPKRTIKHANYEDHHGEFDDKYHQKLILIEGAGLLV